MNRVLLGKQQFQINSDKAKYPKNHPCNIFLHPYTKIVRLF